ncbi:MAG TPA: rhodanese-like domain-containing protein [Actinobacteria bacterium]|nr:thiosulfate sulfurtransferase PspE precursor [bacterium BMS3Bbin01]HDH24920.1 rhodanese-like domain-containing protein [Actinomycetota bacterium]
MRKLLIVTVVFGLLAGACGGTATVAQEIKTITPAEAYQEIQAGLGDAGFVLLDVRTPEEYGAGKLAGADNIDFYAPDFRDKLSQLDKNDRYVIYCRTGSRSGQALVIMRELGFTHVEDIGGGIVAWAQAGLPIVP